MDNLIRKAKKRDKPAFEKLMRLNVPDMYKVAKSILKNDDDAADAIQETMLTCWEKLCTLQKNRYFKTWLTRVLINECNSIRRERSRVVTEEAVPETGAVDESYEAVEWREFLGCLEEKYRVVTILFYVEGFKIREIADILGISQNTVSTRLSAAREKMRKQYPCAPSKTAGGERLKGKEIPEWIALRK